MLNFKAQFKSNTEVELIDENGKLVQTLTADKILINTGAKSNIPNIEGIDSAQNVYDSKGLLNISYQPKRISDYWWRIYCIRICLNVSKLWYKRNCTRI